MKLFYITLFSVLLLSSNSVSAQLYWEENGLSATGGEIPYILAEDAANIPTNYTDWFISGSNVNNQQITTNRNNAPDLSIAGYTNSDIGNIFYTSALTKTGSFKPKNIEYSRRLGNPSGVQEIYLSAILSVFQVRKDGAGFPMGLVAIDNVNNPGPQQRTWAGRLLINKLSGDEADGTYQVGVTKNGPDQAYASATFSTGDIIVVIMKYTMDGTNNANDRLDLYVGNSVPESEPETWSATTTTGDDLEVNGVFLREKMSGGKSEQDHFVDFGHIRVANTFETLFAEAVDVTGINVAVADDASTVVEGTTLQMTAIVTPEDATNPAIEWSVNNESIATINQNGVLSGVALGSVTVTATSVSNPEISGNATIEVVSPPQADNLVWTGEADNNFFNEGNWVIEGTENSPPAGTIDQNSEINANLFITGANISASDDATLIFPEGLGLTVDNTILKFGSLENGFIEVDNGATVTIMGADALATGFLILEDNKSWVKLPNVDPRVVNNDYTERITSTPNNFRVNQYYYSGSLIRQKDLSHTPLTLYDGAGQSGASFELVESTVYGSQELAAFNNSASSFKLERGYMAVMAVFEDGTGKSETFIASEEALEMDLPAALDKTVSFVRVVPWNWVTKKGASQFLDVGNTWTYNWNRTSDSEPNIEYAPMAWGWGGAQPSEIPNYIAKEDVTHVMGFNESDNPDDQSGQYNELYKIEVAVPAFKNLMGTGLRLVSPSPRENAAISRGENDWLLDFRDQALEEDVRYDVVGVHWYDWGSNPDANRNDTPQDIFNRFKEYLDDVYAEHGLPIWITEFNANRYRGQATQLAFLQLALPYLEGLDFVERYDYFEPIEEPGVTKTRFFVEDANGNRTTELTAFGEFYKNFESTPAIPEDTWAGSDFLADMDEKATLSASLSSLGIVEGEEIILTLTSDRKVGAAENINISISGIDDTQYTLSAESVTMAEGSTTIDITIDALNDEVEEAVMSGTITISVETDGLVYTGGNLEFAIIDVLSVKNGGTLELYPNPTTGTINLKTDQPVSSLNIISMEGKTVYQSTSQSKILNIIGLKNGIYVVRAVLSNGNIHNTILRKE